MENIVANDGMRIENAALKAENAALKAELAEVKGKLDWLMEQVLGNRRKMFGASSEKAAYANGDVQLGLFGSGAPEIKVFGDTAGGAAPEPPAKKRPKKRGEMGSRLPDNMPVETIEHVLPEDERTCPDCGGPMHSIGKEVARRDLKIIPAKAIVTEHVRHAYSCRGCEQNSADGSVPVIKAGLPPQVIKGSMCSPETVAHIITQKCVMGAPLHRQEADWNRNGIPIKRQTMASWLIRCSEDYLDPIYDALHWQLCQHKFLHSDGTVFQVLNEPGKTPQSESCMWVYRTSGDSEHPIVLFDYQPDKTQARPKGFLKGFSGYLMTDGASSYNNLPDDIVLVGCAAHVRSKFFDAIKVIKKVEERIGSLAAAGLKYCDDLFAIERKIKDKPFDERRAVRNEEAAPILGEFHAWLLSVQPFVAAKCKIGVAINYALNQWKYLIRYLLDGRIEISNNRCERSVKPFVINRKNFLFADSVAGGRAAAVLHSMTETAKENGLNPHEYLSHIFRTAAGVDLRENHDMVVALLPENVPAQCKATELKQ
jgi:transposase